MKIYTNFNNFLTERIHFNESNLILEGGAAGHMSHPFDNKSLTFGDFKKLIESGLSGELNFEEDPTEKTDGQNLFATVKDGETLFARNKGQMKNPIDLNGIIKMFTGHASKLVEETYIFAAKDLADALPKLKDQSMFANGLNFVNMELIYSKNPNVIYYDRDVIQFHNIVETDGEGNQTGTQNLATELVGALKELKKDVQKTFTIIPPQVLKIAKDIDFEANKVKFIKQVEVLRDRYNLTDADEVSRYHEMWWRETIDANFPDLEQNHKEGLLLRWAYGDKKTLNLRSLDKELGKDKAALIKKFDKEDVKKKYKENIRPIIIAVIDTAIVIKTDNKSSSPQPFDPKYKNSIKIRRLKK